MILDEEGAETKERNENFGTSLLLANSPMSPKIVNGSFAAIFDHAGVLKCFDSWRNQPKDSPHIRRRIKGILMSGKQFSLDSHLDLFHGIANSSDGRPSSVPSSAPPLVEESNEYEEASPNGNGVNFLTVPQQRQIRSKSVDHQVPMMIQNPEAGLVCAKCGHGLQRASN